MTTKLLTSLILLAAATGLSAQVEDSHSTGALTSAEEASNKVNKAYLDGIKTGLDAQTGAREAKRVKLPFAVPGFSAKDEIVWLVVVSRSDREEPDMPGAAWVNPTSGKQLFFHAPWVQPGIPAPVLTNEKGTSEDRAKQLVSKLYRETLKPPYDPEPGVIIARLVKLPVEIEGFHPKDETVWLVEAHSRPNTRPTVVLAWVSSTSSQVVVPTAPWLELDPPEPVTRPRPIRLEGKSLEK